MFANSRFAVPEGKTHVSTSRLRSAYSRFETVPSPPDTTTTSNSSASRSIASLLVSSERILSTHSSPARTSSRSNAKTASDPKPERGL